MLADRIGIPQVRDLAGRSELLVADIALAELPRIADLLNTDVALVNTTADAELPKALHVEAQFADHGQGFPEVQCRVTGSLPLNCQRCLSLLQWDVQVDFTLAIVSTEAELLRVTERFDAVVADEHGFSLLDAVTDELLGSLPLAPMHAEATDCSAVQEYLSGEEEASPDSGQINRPFAELASLVGRNAKAGNTDSN